MISIKYKENKDLLIHTNCNNALETLKSRKLTFNLNLTQVHILWNSGVEERVGGTQPGYKKYYTQLK